MRRLKHWIGLWLWLGFSLAQENILVTFTYDPPMALEVRSVSLRGSFNNWAELPMQKTEEGVWQVTVALPPGVVQYKYFINGQWPQNMCELPGAAPCRTGGGLWASWPGSTPSTPRR